MKTKITYYTILVLIIFSITSCNEDKFLEEDAKSFLTTKNAYVSLTDFEAALADIYSKNREIGFGNPFLPSETMIMQNGTDMWYDARLSTSGSRFGDYVTALSTQGSLALYYWSSWYKVIARANTIIDRLVDSELSDDEKQLIEAEARFFRGYAYRHLVYLYGGVPIAISEINAPKSDFTRASKEEVLNQIVEDLSFASEHLSGITTVKYDRSVSNLVAEHYLAETYIALKDWDKAIAAASVVINDPNMALMNSRFGSRKDETPGDVYWDLFRRGNQNRLSGNTEAIWVEQMATDVPGGLLSSSDKLNIQERAFTPAIATLNDPDGKPLTYKAGSISDMNCGGRGASFGMPSNYFINDVWQSDFNNDIRNANHNLVRTLIYTNPESAWRDSSALKYRGTVIDLQAWRWYPWLTKATTPGNHPDALYSEKSHFLLTANAGSTYRDMYLLRLPETYLIRAEAYMGKGDLPNAASDINVIRARANATPVTSGAVDINYILDERARELSLEEKRRITLMRLGLLVERVRQYNPWNGDEIQDYHNLFPIPLNDQEANIYGDLEQNPGYPE